LGHDPEKACPGPDPSWKPLESQSIQFETIALYHKFYGRGGVIRRASGASPMPIAVCGFIRR